MPIYYPTPDASWHDPRRVLVLGDSSSASLGAVNPTYVDLLVGRVPSRSGVEVMNVSAPGLTSADGLALLTSALRKEHFAAVIVFLGNCDACGYGFDKSSGTLLGVGGAQVARVNGMRAHPFEFSRQPEATSACVPLKDYRSNMAAIVRTAGAAGAKTVLINPLANQHFLPGSQNPNALFYKSFGIDDALPLKLGGVPALLARALRQHAEGELEAAEASYRAICVYDDEPEVIRIATNNLAAILYRRGNVARAIDLIAPLLGRTGRMTPLLKFNLAVAYDELGKASRAQSLFCAAVESDYATYRTRLAYRDCVRVLASSSEGKEVAYIDLGEVLAPEDVADYCHPSIDGHAKIADAVARALIRLLHLPSGPMTATVTVAPANPDAAAGQHATFTRYFGIVVKPTPTRTAEIRQAARRWDSDFAALPAAARASIGRSRAQLAIAAHPVFGLPSVLDAVAPEEPVDQGRLPELFAFRHMAWLYADASTRRVVRECPHLRALLPDEHRVRRLCVLLGIDLQRQARESDRVMAAVSLGAARARTRVLLVDHLLTEPTVFNRYRTITVWYMREAMIFGTASDYTAYYDRYAILTMLDALLVSAYRRQPNAEDLQLRDALESTLAMHASFLRPRVRGLHMISPVDIAAHRSALRGQLQHPFVRSATPADAASAAIA